MADHAYPTVSIELGDTYTIDAATVAADHPEWPQPGPSAQTPWYIANPRLPYPNQKQFAPPMDWLPDAIDPPTVTGTPPAPGVYSFEIGFKDSNYTPILAGTVDLTVTDPDAEVTIPAPLAERTDDGYVLPEAEGVIWTVDGVEQTPGAYAVQAVESAVTVSILPTTDEGYVFEAEPEPQVMTFDPPAPDPGPDPWALLEPDPDAERVAAALAPRVIAHVSGDMNDDPAAALAQGHVLVVLDYVRGYTRGRGFIGPVPERMVQAVIVAAAARLYVNPEQLTYYQAGDYSERPATLTGWTVAELGVLHRYRRRSA